VRQECRKKDKQEKGRGREPASGSHDGREREPVSKSHARVARIDGPYVDRPNDNTPRQSRMLRQSDFEFSDRAQQLKSQPMNTL
jgi:hypothetical protein